MNRHAFTRASLALAMLPLLAGAALAGPTISVENPYARPPMGSGKVAAAFMTLKNDGDEADRLVAAEGDVAKDIQLHTHIMEKKNGKVIMRMRRVPFMAVPAHGKTVLQPGGLHIMLIGTTRDLKPGDTFDLTLVFEKAGKVKVTVPVKKISATIMHKMKMKGMQHGMQKGMSGMAGMAWLTAWPVPSCSACSTHSTGWEASVVRTSSPPWRLHP